MPKLESQSVNSMKQSQSILSFYLIELNDNPQSLVLTSNYLIQLNNCLSVLR